LSDGLGLISGRLAAAEPVLQLFADGLEAYRSRLLRENRLGRIRSEILSGIAADPECGFPHRKIIDFLLSEYDFAKDDFREVHFSRLARQARVGKNRAQSYLSVLERKGFISRRSDGYRMFFRIATQR
jgi:hypothetical protein